MKPQQISTLDAILQVIGLLLLCWLIYVMFAGYFVDLPWWTKAD